jgi:uncharacterized membrane protein YoaK (UPF0700 family)
MPLNRAEEDRVTSQCLVGLTVVTGIIDAVSFLGLGHIFTANMTGNVVFLGFAAVGAPGLSFARSGTALVAFLLGALIGGSMAVRMSGAPRHRWTGAAFGAEAALLLAGTAVAAGRGTDLVDVPARLYPVIGLTGLAMGIRNATVRKLAVPDLTTTVLSLTITGLAADSALAGGQNAAWRRRTAAVVTMFAGAAMGALLLRHSVALALAVSGVVAGGCAVAAYRAS